MINRFRKKSVNHKYIRNPNKISFLYSKPDKKLHNVKHNCDFHKRGDKVCLADFDTFNTSRCVVRNVYTEMDFLMIEKLRFFPLSSIHFKWKCCTDNVVVNNIKYCHT